MRLLVTFLAILFLASISHAQSYWADANPDALAVPESAKLDLYPTHFRTLELNLDGARQYLSKAPLEFTPNARQNALILELPFPDGRMEEFRVVKSPVMKPGLAAKYPMIQTFAAYSASGKPYSARLGYTTKGFHALIRTDEGMIYIDPYAEGQTQYYISFYYKDYDLDAAGIPSLGCGWEPGAEAGFPEPKETDMVTRGLESLEDVPVNLRVYDMALACTGEYGQAKGGTVEAVMSSFNTALNRVNEIVTPEVGFKFELIENNDLLVFLNPNTDPYINSNVGESLLGQNTAVINSIINVNFYDIGHVFTNGCTDVGGIAGGTVCSQNKAKGVTCHGSSNIIGIAERIMAHELAHQFSAGHTWSNCPGILGQLASDSAYEPGSGTTIMSYAGACGPENIQFGEDTYYHVRSLVQMRNYITVSLGSECPDLVPTDNREPVIDWPYENGFFIPISTPFELSAEATDPDGDPLTYCWEQYDLGPLASLGSPIDDSPSFRSFSPQAASNRIFPRLPIVLSNQSEDVEVLPTYSRNLTFRMTVRDNYPGGGGTDWEEVKFKSTDQAGPFLVSYPNSALDQLTGGTFDTITWNVANTDKAPVNCQIVNIRLSVDGGNTFPYTLIAGTPNNGSAVVAIPHITANSARIRVEAADNVFFDLSNSNFKIVPPSEPGFTFQVDAPLVQTVCIPGEIQVPFSSQSVLGYDSLLTLELVSGLPTDATAVFSTTQFLPGESSTLSLNFSQVATSQDATLLVRLTVAGGDTLLFPLYFHLIYENFSALTMDAPFNGESGLDINEAIFQWPNLPNADTYDFQMATSPAFSAETLVHEKYGLTVTTYVPTVVLEKNELYFWRIRAGNQCKTSDFLSPFAFHTIALSCDKYVSNDVPMGIPSTGTPTRTSELTILQDGTINDLNVVDLIGYHEGIQQLKVSLQGPDGTIVKLFGEYCGSTAPFNLDLDDESPFNPPCPPNTGQAYKPAEPLSVFDGQSTAGTWKLVAKVTDEWGNGGLVESWGLEFCASFTPKNPYLENNNLLLVQPGGTRYVYNESLLVQDEDNTAEELTYTLVSPPQHGTLVWYNNELEAGGQFRQISINGGNVWYVHSGDGSLTDSFSFVVEDGTGGWLGITTFEIEVNPNAPIATEEFPSIQPIRLFPNPSTGLVWVALPELPDGDVQIQVVNAQGQTLLRQPREIATSGLDLDLSALPGGMYWILVTSEKRRYSGKVVLQR
ncbi:MAG: T9SS type A sorting domain-containing protein [Saprospirales bacterium]|nr:T9SS type A sorting domain-containing protein [Saprospirales bacterium]